MFYKLSLVYSLFLIGFVSCKNNIVSKKNSVNNSTSIEISLAGNAFITKNVANGTEEITENGLVGWSNGGAVISIYVKIMEAGVYNFGLNSKNKSHQKSSIKITIDEKIFTITDFAPDLGTKNIGQINILKPGYLKIDLQGITKTSDYFPEISSLTISADADKIKNLIYANDPENYYWSRRGPSCHLNYITDIADKEYFYSELTVPKGEDKIGSYFMANGFGEGYFGIQVNSETERRVLFSVWEPENGPKTTLIKKGKEVYAGRFDGEGTGGQSYLTYSWNTGITYKFLTKGNPDGQGNTIFTSWFFAPEIGSWQLIASFKRPQKSTYLTQFHGFLENFIPENGYLSREAIWSNQWVRLSNGSWKEVTEFKFSVDATGKNKQRMDFSGGIENGQFYLKNGGFFEEKIISSTIFTKKPLGIQPNIDFDNLP
jgi:hypothetical protein